MSTCVPPDGRCSVSAPLGRIPPLLSSPWVGVLSVPPLSGSAICVPLGTDCPGLEKVSSPARRSRGFAESPCGEKRDQRYTPRLWESHQKTLPLYVCVAQLCPTLCDPHGLQPTRLLCPWDFPGKDTGVGCHFLLQGTFPAQGSNPGLLHCRQIL